MTSKLRIVVDADACPVKNEIIAVALEMGAGVMFVASYAAFAPDWQLANHDIHTIFVDQAFQAADIYIANAARSGDVVVTNDYGLAALCLPRGAYVITPRGGELTSDNVDEYLSRRHISSKSRRAGIRTKGPRAMSESDRENFQHKLTKLLRYEQEKLSP
ncbi:YaiI/YqxD family protein [Paenibacillus apiarius]|uniref:YaiI/YqxD family protein n=1 Tax=Paenibacillus apiarius TaxID=46240 RepID=UPI001980799B|nr:YaiI/YqxD family protein [Paenibacillus apiarius]MBN3525922.1 YaiI/YqxD family protein [Paenibacillus apiarius]